MSVVVTLIKASLLLGTAIAVVRMTGRTRAAIRHVVLAAAFVGLLILPAGRALLPDVPVPIPMARPADVATILLTTTVGGPVASGERAAAVVASPTSRPVSIEALVDALWTVGVFVTLLPLAAGLRELRRIRRHGVRWPAGEALIAELVPKPGVRRVAVILHQDIAGPMTCGVLRPAIVFPPDAETWDASDIRRAMRHELEHVRRADCLVDAGARLTCALYWFHPLAWAAWRQLRLEAERACDDAVVRGGEAVAYAEQLVTLAARVSMGQAPPVLAMAGSRDLPKRIAAVLDRAQRRGRAGSGWTAGVLVTGLALVGTLAPLCPLWQEVAASPLAFEVVSVKENTSGDPFGGGGDPMTMRIDPGGRFTARNVTVQNLILMAYRSEIVRSQLAPIDPWMERRRFDVDARAAEGVIKALDRNSARMMDRMVQVLLADRFKLRVRRESKTGDVYVLSVATGGLKAKRSENAEACAGGADPQRVKPLADGMLPCHFFSRLGRRGFEAMAVDTTDLAEVLAGVLGAPVEDRARLPMLFDASVHWNSQPLGGSRDASFGAEPQPADDDPDVPTALREQLGLKLEPQRGSVETLVVEHAEMPAPD